MHQYERETGTRTVNFSLTLDDTAWSFVTAATQNAEFIFDAFPDAEVIELEFIRPNDASIYAHLCGAPTVWVREDGILGKYDTTNYDYDLSPCIIDLIEEVKIIPINDIMRHIPDDQQVIKLVLTPSICLLMGVCEFSERSGTRMRTNISTYRGFVGVSDDAEMTASRIQAQLLTICDVLSIQLNSDVELGAVSGEHYAS